MVGYNKLIELLDSYGIDGKKLVGNSNNDSVLKYGKYNNIKKILIFLESVGIVAKSIEKCPSVLYYSTYDNVRSVYEFLVNESRLGHIDIENTLSILVEDYGNVRRIYDYINKKYGINVLKRSPSILTGDYYNIVSLTNTLEKTIGLDIVKSGGGSILTHTTKEEFLKILYIPIFEYNDKTKKYNKKLLTTTTFYRSYNEIIEIISLPYWNDKKYEHLLT